jgi:hypothetical protein
LFSFGTFFQVWAIFTKRNLATLVIRIFFEHSLAHQYDKKIIRVARPCGKYIFDGMIAVEDADENLLRTYFRLLTVANM